MEECRDAAIVGAGTLSGGERRVLVKECKNIRFDGISFTCKRRWTLHLLYSDGIVVENCRFTTESSPTWTTGVTVDVKPWAEFDKAEDTCMLKGLTGTVTVTAQY